MTRVGVVWILIALFGVMVVAQQAKPTFDVISVKQQREPLTLAGGGMGSFPRLQPGGVFNATHGTIESLILFAYGLKLYQLDGGSEWIRMRRETFRVDARAGYDAPVEQVKLMVQSLLEQRFKLVTHVEQRTMRFLALVTARSDRRLGPYLQQVPDDCTPAMAAEVRKQFPPRPSVTGGGSMRGQCVPFGSIADSMTMSATLFATLPVVDMTGLSGKAVYELRTASTIPTDPGAAADPSLPPLPIALEEQFGLKLQEREGPVDVLVIDSVQQPTEN